MWAGTTIMQMIVFVFVALFLGIMLLGVFRASENNQRPIDMDSCYWDVILESPMC